MTTFKKHILIILMACVAMVASAQDRNKWATEMLEAKHKYITEQVGLTKAQADKFMPLYEAMEKEVYAANQAARATAGAVAKKGNSATDADYLKAAEALSGVKKKEGEIEAKYFAQFAKILSKKQLYLLKQAEISFTRSLLQKRNSK
ncbi:MAG: hypothetical protein MJZ74_01835 [Muribaculaceae bacterium]|nr:hypothetical protein [Muribaculaceae bacterium]